MSVGSHAQNRTNGSESIAIEENHAGNKAALSYPERVPNSRRGAAHKHSYVMLGLIIVFLIFSFIISNFTISY